jgi:uncharacterized membrane protein
MHSNHIMLMQISKSDNRILWMQILLITASAFSPLLHRLIGEVGFVFGM